jgi:hypothetical protein
MNAKQPRAIAIAATSNISADSCDVAGGASGGAWKLLRASRPPTGAFRAAADCHSRLPESVDARSSGLARRRATQADRRAREAKRAVTGAARTRARAHKAGCPMTSAAPRPAAPPAASRAGRAPPAGRRADGTDRRAAAPQPGSAARRRGEAWGRDCAPFALLLARALGGYGRRSARARATARSWRGGTVVVRPEARGLLGGEWRSVRRTRATSAALRRPGRSPRRRAPTVPGSRRSTRAQAVAAQPPQPPIRTGSAAAGRADRDRRRPRRSAESPRHRR